MNDLWGFFSKILDYCLFSSYVPTFSSMEQMVDIVPVIVELNKMNVRFNMSVRDPQSVVFASVLRYAGFDVEIVLYVLESDLESSLTYFRSMGYSDAQLLKWSKNFEKLINNYDYSSILKGENKKDELLNCFFKQVIGSCRVKFDVSNIDEKGLMKLFGGQDFHLTEISYVYGIASGSKIIGYLICIGNEYRVMTLKMMFMKKCVVCGCQGVVRLKEVIKLPNGYKTYTLEDGNSYMEAR